MKNILSNLFTGKSKITAAVTTVTDTASHEATQVLQATEQTDETETPDLSTKEGQEAYVDQWILTDFWYTVQIQSIIIREEHILTTEYYKKIANHIMDNDGNYNWSTYLKYLLKKTDFDLPFLEEIFLFLLPADKFENIDKAKEALDFLCKHTLWEACSKLFVQRLVKMYRKEDSVIYNILWKIIDVLDDALKSWVVSLTEYYDTICSILKNDKQLTATESILLVNDLLKQDYQSDVYTTLLERIITDNKLIGFLYFTDAFQSLLLKVNQSEYNSEYALKIISTCVDAYLNWSAEITKTHIKIALTALKKSNLTTKYENIHEKIMRAGMELLVSE